MSTMREVASLAGVSGKTVSRVINHDRYVSVEVRERVQRAIAELAYVPNMLSQTFRTGRDNAIGLAVPDLADPFFGPVVQAITEQARLRSTAVLVTSLGTRAGDEQPAVESLLRRHIAGLIMAPTGADHRYLADWSGGTRLVFIDRPPRQLQADVVLQDDEGGARAAVEHLLDNGHRRIAFVGRESSLATISSRRDGYRAALRSAGVPADRRLEATAGPDVGPAATLAALLGLDDPPTAIFSADSQTSIALVPELQRRRYRGLALVSFGDFPMAGSLRPSVSVVDQDPAALGQAAADRLFTRLDEPGRKLRRRIVVPVQLRIRQSSGPPLRRTSSAR